MQRSLAFLSWTALGLVIFASADVAPTAGSSPKAFAYVEEGLLFGSCLAAVRQAKAPGVSFSKACQTAFQAASPQVQTANGLFDDCQELSGRASEASDEGFLGDGRLLCGRLTLERARVGQRPLQAFTPKEGGAVAGVFCDVMDGEEPPPCAPAATRAAASTVVAPVAPIAAAPVAATATIAQPQLVAPAAPVPAALPALRGPVGASMLRAAEVQPVVLARTAPSQAAPQVALAPSLPTNDAAAVIASGVFPSFARQVPRALAAVAPAGALEPSSLHVEATPELSNGKSTPELGNIGSIWTNLAALLHRTG